MTKLLKISALSAFTLLFAACDPEMAGADVEDRAFHGKMFDIADSDDEDEGFDILDDLSDAEPAPAPMVEYDLDLAAEDEDPCDTWGPDGDLELGDVDAQAAIDDQRPLGIDHGQGDETWGPDEDDVDIGDAPDGAGENPSDDDEPPIGTPDDNGEGWGDLDFDGDNNSGDDDEGPSDDDEPPVGTPDDDGEGWGDLDFDGDNNSDDEDDIDDIDGN